MHDLAKQLPAPGVFTPVRTLASALLLLAGCVVVPFGEPASLRVSSLSTGSASLSLNLVVTPGDLVQGASESLAIQTLRAAPKLTDVHHVSIAISRVTAGSEVPVVRRDGRVLKSVVPASALGERVVIDGLNPGTELRIRARAWRDEAESDATCLNLADKAVLSLSTGADGTSTDGQLAIRLDDLSFAGSATPSLVITPGEVLNVPVEGMR